MAPPPVPSPLPKSGVRWSRESAEGRGGAPHEQGPGQPLRQQRGRAGGRAAGSPLTGPAGFLPPELSVAGRRGAARALPVPGGSRARAPFRRGSLGTFAGRGLQGRRCRASRRLYCSLRFPALSPPQVGHLPHRGDVAPPQVPVPHRSPSRAWEELGAAGPGGWQALGTPSEVSLLLHHRDNFPISRFPQRTGLPPPPEATGTCENPKRHHSHIPPRYLAASAPSPATATC